jgi:CRP-like cAMP-binding protein
MSSRTWRADVTPPPTTTMSDVTPGLPLTSSRVEQIFPTLTQAQIRRIAAHGHMRTMQRGEVLVEQGDSAAWFFVVVAGEVEVVRPSGATETLITVFVLVSSRARSTRSPAAGLFFGRALPRRAS